MPFLPEGFEIQVIPTTVDPFTLMTSAPGRLLRLRLP